MKTEKKLDHGYTGISKYRIEVFNESGDIIATFKHVERSYVQEFVHAIDNLPDCAFTDCTIFIHRELSERGELDD